MMARAVHFKIGARDTDKITKFYENVFGWVYFKDIEGNKSGMPQPDSGAK